MNNSTFVIIILINALVLGGVIAFAVYHAREHFAGKSSKKESRKTYMPVLPHDTRQRILEEAEEEYSKVLEKTANELERTLAATTSRLNAQINSLGDGIMNDEMQRYKSGLDELRNETKTSIARAENEITEHQTTLRSKLLERQAGIDKKLADHEAALEAQLATRESELENEFKERRAAYAKRQAELEAKLAEHQAELEATVKERETKLAEAQAALDQELLGRQKQATDKQAALEAKLEESIAAKRAQYEAQLDTKAGDVIAGFLSEALGKNVDLGAQLPYLIETLNEHKDELKKELAQ